MIRLLVAGLLAALVVAAVHALGWAIVELTWGLLIVALVGGWLIGSTVKAAAAGQAAGAQPPVGTGLPVVAGLLGVVAWLAGSYLAFVIVQLNTGSGPVADRLGLGNFAPYMQALLDPPLLQLPVLGAYVASAWLTARSGGLATTTTADSMGGG